MQEVINISRTPGSLEFDARIGGHEHRVWIRGGDVTPSADPALALGLLPAMSAGGTLRVEGEISPRILRMQAEFQAIQQVWSKSWAVFGNPPLHEVEVEARSRPVPEPNRGRVAAFFSGGVDSWATLLTEPSITDLIFVRGFDILPAILDHHIGLAERIEPRLQAVADELGLPLHTAETNIREFSDPLAEWSNFNACGLCAVALYFEPLFERVVIPTDTDHATQVEYGASRMINSLWSTEALEIVDHGSRLGRFERTRLIAGDPRVQRSLRVCYENPEGEYNCGRCLKCTLTLLALEALGVREEFSVFPPGGIDFSRIEELTPSRPIQQVLWADCLRGLEECDREDLARRVRPAVERGERVFADPALIAAIDEAAEERERAEAAEAKLAEVLGSTSWRITAPLRKLRARRA